MSKYFNGDKLSGYEDSPITYVYGSNLEECHKVIADLEAKLAESEKELNRYAELFGMKDKDFYVVEKSEYDKMRQGAKEIVNQLKQQLAEKDKEIEELKTDLFVKNLDREYGCILGLQNAENDKISFAVEQLNLLYKTLTTEDVWRAMRKGWWLNNGECLQLRQTIDNQIKAIKGEK